MKNGQLADTAAAVFRLHADTEFHPVRAVLLADMQAAGLNLKAVGAVQSEAAVAVSQSSPAGEQLPQGSLVTVTFYDYTVPADEDVKMD